MYGTFDLKNRVVRIEAAEYTYFENSKCVAFYDGLPADQIEEFFREGNLEEEWKEAFISPFILILFQKDSGKMLIIQHLFGSGKNLYLCKKDNKICLASSLRELKQLVQIPFKLNIPMLPYYFYNGFLPGTHTLIDGVQKLGAGTYVIIDNSGIHKEPLKFSDLSANINSENSEIEYHRALTGSIYEVTKDITDTISLALSGGYDSNCILYSIKKRWPNVKVNAFSVGGVNGVDETGIAAEIAKYYDNVSFRSSFVSPDTLDHLDEIVSILEGSVYERGIFLQYELAKLLTSNRVRNLICGECADQVFHRNTYSPIPENTFLYGYLDTPYQMAVYAVLKKNRMMMNAFGINTRYPFLTPQMLSVGYMTREINGTTKEFHKTQCRELFPPEILDLISKQGGSTDLGALFQKEFDCSKELEKCKYYSTDFRLTGKYSYEEAIRDYYLSLLYLESFEKQFCD